MATANSAAKSSASLPQLLWQQLSNTASQLQTSVDHIHWVVALSGGKDSTALAHALKQCSDTTLNVTLAHIHHGLQDVADSWIAHCETQAKQLGFAFYTERVNVEVSSRQSVEANARNARYQALRRFCQQSDGVLLIAQHQDDQLETVLLQLKRGVGPKGLAGMALRQCVDGVWQVRPWLNVPQRDIERYVDSHRLSYITDPSNADLAFDRNFLRNQVLPLLTKRWPGMAKAVNRTAELCAQQNTLIEEHAEHWLCQHQVTWNCLPLDMLQIQSAQWQKEILRVWCRKITGTVPSKKQLDAFFISLYSEPDRQPLLTIADYLLRRHGQTVYLTAKSKSEDGLIREPAGQDVDFDKPFVVAQWSLKIELIKAVESSNTDAFKLPLSTEAKVHISWINPEQRLTLADGRQKSASSLFKDYKVPPWCRQETIGVFMNNTLVLLIHQEGIVDEFASASSTGSHAYLVVSHHTRHGQPA